MPDVETRLTMLEARMIAHRRLLARLVTLLGKDARDDTLAWIEDREILRDGQEDPSALPSDAAVLSLSIAEEFNELRKLALTRPMPPAALPD